MKKQRSLFISITALSILFNGISMAENQTVTSDIVGIVKIQKEPGLFKFIGCNFESTTNSTFEEFTEVTQFSADTSQKKADKIITDVNSSNVRDRYVLYESTPAQWRNKDDFTTPNPDGIPMQTGQAVWLKSKNDTFNNSLTSFTFTGEVVKAPQQSFKIKEGQQLICFPFSCDINITDLVVAGGTASTNGNHADKIYMLDYLDGEKLPYAYFGLYENEGGTVEWKKLKKSNKNFEFTEDEVTRVISIGEGFFYQAVNDFTWVIKNPYLDDLK